MNQESNKKEDIVPKQEKFKAALKDFLFVLLQVFQLFLVPFLLSLFFVFIPYDLSFEHFFTFNSETNTSFVTCFAEETSTETGSNETINNEILNFFESNHNKNDSSVTTGSITSFIIINSVYYSFAHFVWIVVFDFLVPMTNFFFAMSSVLFTFLLIIIQLIVMYLLGSAENRILNFSLLGLSQVLCTLFYVILVSLFLFFVIFLKKAKKSYDSYNFRKNNRFSNVFLYMCFDYNFKNLLKSLKSQIFYFCDIFKSSKYLETAYFENENSKDEKYSNLDDEENNFNKESKINEISSENENSGKESKEEGKIKKIWKTLKGKFKDVPLYFFVRMFGACLYMMSVFGMWMGLQSFSTFWIESLRESEWSVLFVIIFHVSEVIAEIYFDAIIEIIIVPKYEKELKLFHVFIISCFFNMFHRFVFVEINSFISFFVINLSFFVYNFIRYPLKSSSPYHKLHCFILKIVLNITLIRFIFPHFYKEVLEEKEDFNGVWRKEVSLNYFINLLAKYSSLFWFLIMVPVLKYHPYNCNFFPLYRELSAFKFGLMMTQMGFLVFIESLEDLFFIFFFRYTFSIFVIPFGNSFSTKNNYVRMLYSFFFLHVLHDIFFVLLNSNYQMKFP